ncbi:class I SAM-dependent methyltransferase [Pseudonocardia spinosispora]|uniref:class I SAM-dependent methyltransferase n=1 Tax=Pseudonocardia spinosispora TaxID=103441 RepID=UPI00040B2579|nr:class I SAM-dependent methyltransferase [Pseudonocardia spinosispora]
MTAADATTPRVKVDDERLEQLVNGVIADAGGALALPLALIGDRLGLFGALADHGPATATELAQVSGTATRYVQEWLLAMASAGYVEHLGGEPESENPTTARYQMTPEQAEIFINLDSPHYLVGMFQNMTAATRMIDRLTEAFRTGEGIGWHEHHNDLFEGTERFFRPAYTGQLIQAWIPAVPGLAERLHDGGHAADIGCGLGTSTRIMADAFPKTRWLGLDYHQPSIERARQRVAAAGGPDNLEFVVGAAGDLTGRFDLVAFFDCLHDMPDPLGALRAARVALADDGVVMLVEPMSWDSVSEVFNPLGRVLTGASLLVCLPSGLSAPPAAGLGNQTGPARTSQLARDAGFGSAEVVVSGPTNLVYALRR